MRPAVAVFDLWQVWAKTWVTPLHRTFTWVWTRLWVFADLLRRSALAAVEHDALTVAQAVAYSAIVALFPALIVAAAVVGLLPALTPLRAQLALFFARIVPSSVLPLLESYFSVTQPSQTAGALVGSLAVSLLGAGNVMATLMEGFRRAHDLPVVKGSFFERRGRALALVPLSLVPMAAASALVVFGNSLTRWIAGTVPVTVRPGFMVLVLLLRWAVALAGSMGILAVIYHLGTDPTTRMWERLQPWLREPWNLVRHQWSWRASLPGATLATLLWFLATLLFGFYVTRFANYSRIYGSLGAGIALMIWLYIIALCVLIGAEFNAQRAHLRGSLSSAKSSR